MSPEEQRIKIAEACGIENIQKGGYCYIPEGQKFARSKPVPDYLNDLNDMHEAEIALGCDDTTRIGHAYYDNLLAIRGREKHPRPTVFATSAQRAEAFLRTLGLWKDDACPQSEQSTSAST